MLDRLKTVAERLAGPTGVAAFGRGRMAGRGLVLAYHNVLPDDCPPFGDRSLHLYRRRFAEQLDALQAHHVVVPLTELAGTAPGGTARRVAITFDDAYQGALTAGLAELASRGLPATIFVTPGFVGGRSFWWDALVPSGAEGLTAESRTAMLEEMRGEDEKIRQWAASRSTALQGVPPVGTAATLEQLQAAQQQPGITFGVHTWSHPNLAQLTSEEIDHELTVPLTWLRERFSAVVPWVSYPYGLVSAAVLARAQAAGFEGGLLVQGGWLPREIINPLALPRYNVPAGLSTAGFTLRLAGIRCR